MAQPLWKLVRRFLKKLRIELPYDPAIPLLGIYTKKMKTLIQKDTSPSIFTEPLFIIAKIQKQPKCPSTDEWEKKLWYIYKWTYSVIKRNEMSFAAV